MRQLAASALAAWLLGGCAHAWAWGEQGHRITGLVAERLLTPDARAGLHALMGSTDLATMSLFMDRQKESLAQRSPGSREWHYDDRPVCAPRARRTDYCPDGHCASVQINRHYRRLIDRHSSRDERRFAVHVLVHLVGDIHQPLHAADNDDRGGNDVRVSFALPGGQLRKVNLHSAWDTDFVRAAFATQDERRLAHRLVADAGESAIRAMQKGAAAQWMAESYAIAQDIAYGKLPGFACSSDASAADLAAERLPLDGAYLAHATGVVPTQLLRAGARIAHLLNRAFAR